MPRDAGGAPSRRPRRRGWICAPFGARVLGLTRRRARRGRGGRAGGGRREEPRGRDRRRRRGPREPGPARAARTVADWRALGVDDVRLFAQWGRISPRAGAERAPAGFDAADPDAPGYDWSALDRAVALVRGAGMAVTLSVTGPGPVWATASPRARNPRLNPVPGQFGRFARAVATRYGAQVDRYILWNEPNLPLWLQPQFTCRGRTCTPASPHLYRRLVRAAQPAIRAADPGARVLIGALAPSGQNPRSRNATMRPLTFLRALGCVDAARAARPPRAVRRLPPAAADGIAYHPHGVRRAPDARAPNADDAGLADLGRLEGLLDASSAPAGCATRSAARAGSTSTSPSTATRPTRPTGSRACARRCRPPGCSRARTWRGATRACAP